MKKLIAFFEIPATDFRRAVDFYETVLNMKLPVFECEQEKMACFTEDGETVGAISQSFDLLPDFQPSEKGVLIHFNTDNIATTLERVLQKGGKVLIPCTKIEPMAKVILQYLPIRKATASVFMQTSESEFRLFCLHLQRTFKILQI